jgi:predicted dehydrogenase
MTPSALIVGYGSIGARHARVLEQLGFRVSVASRRGEGGGYRLFASPQDALAVEHFNCIVISDETARHAETLTALATLGHRGSVLVEKPLFARPQPLPANSFARTAVGYNLRFHPVIRALRRELADRAVDMATLHVGQWLGSWRPGREMAASYSASRAAGGGVLRDLSHELDLALWLFGPWIDLTARGGRLGNVTADADDAWGILLGCERCPLVTVQLDCLDRIGRRAITVQADGETLHADLIAGTLQVGARHETLATDRDATYLAMHRALEDGAGDVCTLEEGLRVCELVAAIEQAAQNRRWVRRAA